MPGPVAFDAVIAVSACVDPVVDQVGFDLGSNYVECAWGLASGPRPAALQNAPIASAPMRVVVPTTTVPEGTTVETRA